MLDNDKIVKAFSESYKPLQEQLEQVSESMKEFSDSFLVSLDIISRATRPLSAIGKLADVQYTFWEYLTPDFVNEIVATTSADKAIEARLCKEEFISVKNTINNCEESPIEIKCSVLGIRRWIQSAKERLIPNSKRVSWLIMELSS